jgi:hypothetical protein
MKTMKKTYKLLTIAMLSLQGIAQTQFWNSVNYKGAFPVTDGLSTVASNDWTKGWANWDPEITVYPAGTTTISANITTNTTWTSGNTYVLVGNIAVTPGNTLTIQPGTVIRGDKTSKACLIITAGAKINAVGTATNPIVFTSNETTRANGDWGGVVLCGYGIINTACPTCTAAARTNYVEGFALNFPEILYGGTNNADNSGTMSYCRIEFAGVALSATPNSELNSLTMGGVGSGTTLDHIQCSFGGDDSFEWFGGAVDAKYLIAFRGIDDDFDTDFGYIGRVQFGLSVRDKDKYDIIAGAESNGFESDNFNPGLGRTPITKAIFSNMTMIGPKRDGTASLPGSQTFKNAIYTRRNTAISVHNSIIVGWPQGWHLKDGITFDNYNANSNLDSMGVIKNTIITTDVTTRFVFNSGGANSAWYDAYAGANSIDTTKTVAQVAFVNAFPTNLYDNSDFRLSASSTASTGASFAGPQFAGQIITSTVSIGVNELSQVLGNSFNVYPNPASDNANVTFTLLANNKVSITVYDILGKVVTNLSQENNFEKGNNVVKLNTSELSSGIYFVAISVNNAKEVSKLIISK